MTNRELLERALRKRDPLRAATDALRIVDGRGGEFDDFIIDDFAGRWLVQTRAAAFPEWLRETNGWRALYWKQLAENKAAPAWIAGEHADEPFVITEHGTKFLIDFSAGYSQGIFLDQRDNRAELRRLVRDRAVLNCFAYTCAFGVAAALGGARTVNVDLSKRYLGWGRQNYELNSIDPAAHEFIFGDVFDWLARLAKKRRVFDVVVLDPPTFSRSEQRGVFRAEADFSELARAAAGVLAPGGKLFCSTNARGISRERFRALIAAGVPAGARFDFRPMPPDFRGGEYLKGCWVSWPGAA